MRSTVTAGLLFAISAWAGDGGSAAAPPAREAAKEAAKPAAKTPTADAGAQVATAKPVNLLAATPVFLVAETTDVLDKLDQVAPKDRAGFKGLTTKMVIGKRYWAGIYVDGYTLPRSRRVSLSADITITAPNGDVIVERVSAATARTLDPKHPAVYLKPPLPMVWGLTDEEGEYTVHLKLYDEVRGESSEQVSKLTVAR